MFALFSGAGIGLAILAQFLAPRNAPARLAIGAAAAFAVAGGAVLAALSRRRPMRRPSAPAREPSNLDLAALYEPFIRPGEDLAIGATFGDTAVLSWPLFERCKCTFQIDRPWVGLQSTRAEVAAAGKAWLETTGARQAVLVDMPGDAGRLLALRKHGRAGRTQCPCRAGSTSFARSKAATRPARILILQRP